MPATNKIINNLKNIIENFKRNDFLDIVENNFELLDSTFEDGSTPLIYATKLICRNNKKNYQSFLEILRESGANANVTNRDGDTALKIAIKYKKIDLIKELIKFKDIDLNKTDNNGVTPIVRMIELYLDACTNYDENLLEIYGDIIKLLASNGANINHIYNGQTPLHTAIDKNKRGLRKLLFTIPSLDVNIKDNDGNTPLNFILDKYINSSVKDITWLINVIENLIEKNADVSEPNNIDNSPLTLATYIGSKELVELLLANKSIKINHNSFYGTALMIAIDKLDLPIIKLLLNQPAIDTNIRGLYNYTPLLALTRKLTAEPDYNKKLEYYKVIEKLLEKGADPKLTDNKNASCVVFIAHSIVKCNNRAEEILLVNLAKLMYANGAGIIDVTTGGNTFRGILKHHGKTEQYIDSITDPNFGIKKELKISSIRNDMEIKPSKPKKLQFIIEEPNFNDGKSEEEPQIFNSEEVKQGNFIKNINRKAKRKHTHNHELKKILKKVTDEVEDSKIQSENIDCVDNNENTWRKLILGSYNINSLDCIAI